MNLKTGVGVHNRFDIVVRDAETNEVIQTAQAENMVLDRLYNSYLLSFATGFFGYIVYGEGTNPPTAPTAGMTALIKQISGKAATDEKKVLNYPTSEWTRKIQLGSSDANGKTITEVGISNNTSNANTHAFITNAEGHPISIEKTALKIVDIYATLYVTIYDIDWGFKFIDNGLRTYLTGGSAPSNSVGISFWDNGDDKVSLSGTRTADTVGRKTKITREFNIGHFNKDVKYLHWDGVGLRCQLPRTGVFTSFTRVDVPIGTGDDVKTVFPLPNKHIKNLAVKINDVPTVAYTSDLYNSIVFANPPGDGMPITASYDCTLIPKSAANILDVTFEIAFDISEPSPVMPTPAIPTLPGAQSVIAGTSERGFFGEVTTAQLISGEDLCEALGLTAGILQNSTDPWLKYVWDGVIMYVAKKTIRHTISWNDINAVGAVFGDAAVTIGGIDYAVGLLSSNQWNGLIYPVHVDFGQWAQYTDADLRVRSSAGDGSYSWTSTPSDTYRVLRGGSSGVTYSAIDTPSTSGNYYGFRPVLIPII